MPGLCQRHLQPVNLTSLLTILIFLSQILYTTHIDSKARIMACHHLDIDSVDQQPVWLDMLRLCGRQSLGASPVSQIVLTPFMEFSFLLT